MVSSALGKDSCWEGEREDAEPGTRMESVPPGLVLGRVEATLAFSGNSGFI